MGRRIKLVPSHGLTKRIRRQRGDQATSRVPYRTVIVRKELFAAKRGFVTVNDRPAFAFQPARYLTAAAPQ